MTTALTVIEWNRAKLWTGENATGFSTDGMTVYFPEVAREDLDGVVVALKGIATVTDPMKGTRWARSGEWARGRIWFDWTDPARQDRLHVFVDLMRGGLVDGTVLVSGSAAEFVWVTNYLAVGEVPALPAANPAAGVFYRMGAVVRDRDTGRITTYIERHQVVNQSGTEWELRADETRVTLRQSQAQAPLVQTGVSGKVVRGASDPTEAGRYRTELTTVTPLEFDSGWVSYPDRFGNSLFREFLNKPLAWVRGRSTGQLFEGVTPETQNSVTARPNEFGLFDGWATRQAVKQSRSDDSFIGSSYKVRYSMWWHGNLIDVEERTVYLSVCPNSVGEHGVSLPGTGIKPIFGGALWEVTDVRKV